jgi:NAD(P) transhydrogenase subunit alpha
MALTAALGYGTLFSETGVQCFFIMVLCTFIGFWSACRVNGSFHAPLMGLTNAMSSMVIFLAITFYKALLTNNMGFMRVLNTVTIFFLAMNLVGGLLITHRMLSLFFQ